MDSQNTDVEMGGANADETRPIFLLASDCDDLFQKIRGNEKASPSLKRHLDEYSYRFDSWASFLGVFAEQAASLDYRLRRHPDFQDMIARLLDILRSNLFVLSQSVDIPWPPESSRQVHSNVSSHYGASGEVGDHVTLDKAPSERNAAVSGIAESISRLNKLGIAIRQSSRSTATARARRFAAQHLDLDAFEDTAYDALEILYPNAPETLRQQLCNAMTDRYVKHQYEAYRLGKSNIQYPSKAVQNDARNKATQLDDNMQPSEIRPDGESDIPNPASDQPTRRPNAVDSFRASTIDTRLLHQNVAAAVTSASRPPRTLSVFNENDRWNEPHPPKFENGKDLTDCEWCFQLIDRSFVDGSGWSDAGRLHYREDLQPFVCISEECADSRPGYPSRTEWFDHMKTHSPAWSPKIHRQLMWRCYYNHDNDAVYTFSNPNNLYNHILLHHEHQVVRPNVAEIWEQVAEAAVDDTRPADVCPLCFFIVVGADFKPRKRRQSQDEGPEKWLKSAAKRSKVTFAEGVSGPDEPLNKETKGPVLEEIADEAETDGLQATSYTLGWHIAAHLQYLMFLSLRLMVTHNETKDDEDDVRSFSLAPESGASQSEERRAETWGDISHEGHGEISQPSGRGTNTETKKSAPAEGDDEEEISEVILSDDIRYVPDTVPSENDNWKGLWEGNLTPSYEQPDENALISLQYRPKQDDDTLGGEFDVEMEEPDTKNCERDEITDKFSKARDNSQAENEYLTITSATTAEQTPWIHNNFIDEKLREEFRREREEELLREFLFRLFRRRDETWTPSINNQFAASFFNNQPWSTPSGSPVSAQLCLHCADLMSLDHSNSAFELRTLGNNCPLCKLLLNAVPHNYSGGYQQVPIVRDGLALRVTGGRPRIIRLCANLEPSTDGSHNIQIGPPVLQTINRSPTGSALYFQLLREWLQECDQSHKCNRRKPYWPTRVIFVGGLDPNKLELRERADREESEDYIVLSHCWGNPKDEEKKRFCTTLENYCNRVKEGFSYNDLPKTFQDAVQVTRELKKEYLWIDSLCIIQGDKEDWKNEARCMEKVFASAYCTIAGSSAPNWQNGFLNPELSPQYFQIEDSSGRQVYVYDNTNDFSKDVDEGPLNKRAWVLQERVLSRRTIHFSAKQTYWECGKGVLCGNFTKLECPPGKQYFILDPNFPERLTYLGHDRTINFVKFLFKKYSQRDLTDQSDRDTAISGLLERMESALETQGRYGVFRCFLSHLLLWKRSDEEKTAPINYKGRKEPPSWSWMAFYGGIDFVSNSSLMVPDSEDLRFDTSQEALIVKVRQFKNCRPEQEEKDCAIFADSGRVGSLWFDMGPNNQFKHCVVIGMRQDKKEDPQKTYYILAVLEKPQDKVYKRLGVGEVEARYISKESDTGKLV